MTNAIEVTKREMYEAIANLKGRIEINYSVKDMLAGVDEFEHTLEDHVGELCKARATLVTERDTLRNRVQVLEMANATSGEVIRSLKREAEQARKELMVARLTEFAAQVSGEQENVASDALDAKTEAILGAVVDCKRVITDWSLKGLKSKEAMQLVFNAVCTPKINSALHAFEQPEQYMEIVCHAQYDDGVRTTRSLHPISGCMHSFHPAFPSGELCTFCGVGK